MSRFNPHFPNAASVFDAAAKFKQRCLLDQQSLLLDGQTLWSTVSFQALIDNYVKQPDMGQGGFYEKLACQLATFEGSGGSTCSVRTAATKSACKSC